MFHHTGGHTNCAIICFGWAQTVVFVGGGLFYKGTSKLEKDSLIRVLQRLCGIGNMACFKHSIDVIVARANFHRACQKKVWMES